MGLNELIFGGMAVLGIVVFMFVCRFRTNRSQRDRADRLKWTTVDKGHSPQKRS